MFCSTSYMPSVSRCIRVRKNCTTFRCNATSVTGTLPRCTSGTIYSNPSHFHTVITNSDLTVISSLRNQSYHPVACPYSSFVSSIPIPISLFGIKPNSRRPATKNVIEIKRSAVTTKRKKLKKNQLGQKGQNRTQIKKERKERENLKLSQSRVNSRSNDKNKKSKNRKISRKLSIHNENSLNSDLLEVSSKDYFSDVDENESEDESEYLLPPIESTIIRPPAMLVSTFSKNVFISKIASEKYNIDPCSLFRNNNTSGTRELYVHFPRATFEHTPAFSDNPQQQQPEVGILGRSNVGKSSLINAIIRRNGLAVTSKQPGRTQQAYYYGYFPHGITTASNVDDAENARKIGVSTQLDLQNKASGFIVDLPGYGYAVGPDKCVDEWQQKTQDFLLNRRDNGTLRRMYLLQDSRTGALQLDLTVQNWMEDALIPYTVVLTKIDAVSPSTVVKYANMVCMRYHHKFITEEDYTLGHTKEAKGLKTLTGTTNIDDLAGSSVDDRDMNQIQIANLNGKHLHFPDNETGLWMSPFVHTTSAKAGIGIPELREAIHSEFKMSNNNRFN